MAKKNKIKNIFLSASVPEPGNKFYEALDVIAIRDAVIALASAVLVNPKYHLIWGGHPSITPLITLVLDRYDLKMSDRVTLYQSEHFRKLFPPENKDVGNRIITEDKGDYEESLKLMHEKMIGDNDYVAAVFIGGKDGVLEEFELFQNYHPDALILPIASTGAASRNLYETHLEEFDNRLLTELSYTSLFKELLGL